MPLRDELIIKKSIEFYSDDSPCFLHRSAVMKRLYLELEDFFANGIKNGRREWLWSELPDNIQIIVSSHYGINKLMCL